MLMLEQKIKGKITFLVSYFKIQQRDSNENVTNKKFISKTINLHV